MDGVLNRIQLSRKKGWRKPPNCVSVARPWKWGNPYRVGVDGTAEECVMKFRTLALANLAAAPEFYVLLRGKHLGCWCKIGAPCHADVLLELANEVHANGTHAEAGRC